jgi:hypothetical protein
MKSLGLKNNDFHILQGPAVHLQKQLTAMAERYDVTVHAVNITNNGDAVIVVERKKKV